MKESRKKGSTDVNHVINALSTLSVSSKVKECENMVIYAVKTEPKQQQQKFIVPIKICQTFFFNSVFTVLLYFV